MSACLTRVARSPPQDSSYAVKVFPFTTSIKEAKQNVGTMKADGGGDGPESLADGIHAVTQCDFRKDAIKIVVLISDAPPHGLGDHGDGFPDGCPCGHDPHALVADAFRSREIVVYSVGCEPAIQGNTAMLLRAWSKMTGGRYVPLGNAAALGSLIIGGAKEELELDKLATLIDEECVRVREEGTSKGVVLDDAEVFAQVTSKLQSRGVQTRQVRVDDVTGSESADAAKSRDEFIGRIAQCKTLAEVRALLATAPAPLRQSASAGRPPRGMVYPMASATSASSFASASPAAPSGGGWASQRVEEAHDSISYGQVERLMGRKMASAKSSYTSPAPPK